MRPGLIHLLAFGAFAVAGVRAQGEPRVSPPPWPHLLGPEAPVHVDPPHGADQWAPQLSASSSGVVRLVWLGTRNGAHDVFQRRVATGGGFDLGPTLRPHQDQGAFRQGAGASFQRGRDWWVLWLDTRRGEGTDVLIRPYRDEGALGRERAVNAAGHVGHRREATGLAIPGGNLLVAWVEERAGAGPAIRLRALDPMGVPLAAEEALYTAGLHAEIGELHLKPSLSGPAARIWWLEGERETARVCALDLLASGGAVGPLRSVPVDARSFDVVASGSSWILGYASAATSGRERGVHVLRIDGELAPRGPGRRLSSARQGRVRMCSISAGVALVASAAGPPEESGRHRTAIELHWLDGDAESLGRIRPLVRGRAASAGYGAVITPLPHSVMVAWTGGLQPVRDLHCARVAAWPARDVEIQEVIADRGRADQRLGAVAMSPDGAASFAFLEAAPGGDRIAWRSRDPNGSLGPQLELRGRGSPFSPPALARDASGNTLVAWVERDRRERYRLRCLAIDAAGRARGRGRILATSPSSSGEGLRDGGTPAVCAHAGGFAVLHASSVVDTVELVLQHVSTTGRPLGSTHRVTSISAPGQITSPALAWSSSGEGLAVWQQSSTGGGARIRARRLTPALVPHGAIIEVDDVGGLAGSEPQVAAAGDGTWLVVWTREGIDRTDVVARGFDTHMAPLGTTRRISAGTGEQDRPAVAWIASGRFLAVWEDDLSSLDETFLRVLDRSAQPLGPWYRLHRDRSGAIIDRVYPRIASDGAQAIAIWMDRRRGFGFDVYHSVLRGE